MRSRYETTGRVGGIGAFHHGPNGKFSRPFLGALTPLQDVIGIITPAALHYYDSHGYIPPDIDPKQHRLLVHGMVDRPMIFTLDELKRLPAVTRTHFIECNANGTTSGHGSEPEATPQITHGLTSCSIWTGVKLSRVLDMVGVKKGASLDSCRSGGGDSLFERHPDGESDGRLPASLRPKWRGRASRAGLPTAADISRL